MEANLGFEFILGLAKENPPNAVIKISSGNLATGTLTKQLTGLSNAYNMCGFDYGFGNQGYIVVGEGTSTVVSRSNNTATTWLGLVIPSQFTSGSATNPVA